MRRTSVIRPATSELLPQSPVEVRDPNQAYACTKAEATPTSTDHQQLLRACSSSNVNLSVCRCLLSVSISSRSRSRA